MRKDVLTSGTQDGKTDNKQEKVKDAQGFYLGNNGQRGRLGEQGSSPRVREGHTERAMLCLSESSDPREQ